MPPRVASGAGNRAPRHWRIALALGGVGLVAVLLLMPYLFALLPDLSEKIRIPLPTFIAAQSLQAGILVTLLGWAGLRMGYPNGLDARYLRISLDAGTAWVAPPRWMLACVLGCVVALACVVFSILSPLSAPASLSHPPAWWRGLLASAYGGVVEEVLCRLFMMSLLVWILARVFSASKVPAGVFWAANVAAALIFGAGHLPALAQMHALTSANVVQVVALNGICGIVYGWLFWHRGLEHAIAAHFSTDIVLHVLAPLLHSA